MDPFFGALELGEALGEVAGAVHGPGMAFALDPVVAGDLEDFEVGDPAAQDLLGGSGVVDVDPPASGPNATSVVLSASRYSAWTKFNGQSCIKICGCRVPPLRSPP